METVFLITSWQHLKCRDEHCPTCVANTLVLCAYNAVSLACMCSTLCPHGVCCKPHALIVGSVPPLNPLY